MIIATHYDAIKARAIALLRGRGRVSDGRKAELSTRSIARQNLLSAGITFAVVVAAITVAQTTTATISGPARIVDGDTVVVGDVHVRLKGVDASELGNPLGEAARLVMIRIVGSSNLTCQLTGEKTYGREVGFCFTDAGVDINKEIIAQGAALACPRYSDRYVPYEQAAAIKVQPRAHYCVR